MAIEKMLLVRAMGAEKDLDSFLSGAAASDLFHPENALEFLSSSLGYTSARKENPYKYQLERLKETADLAGITLSEVTSDEALLNTITDDSDEYLNDLKSKILQASEDIKLLADQRQICEDYVKKLSHFTNLDVIVDDLISCEFLVVRFGSIPKRSFVSLAAYENNPYVLFTTCSTDANCYWGVYCAPREQIDDVDAIFASLYFEELKINSASGTAEEIMTAINENIRIIDEETAKLKKRIDGLAADSSEHINRLYAVTKAKSDGFDLRRFAAVRNEDFYCVGWIPSKHKDEFERFAHLSENVSIIYEKPDPEKQMHSPPTKLKNNPVFRPFEYYVEMYGMPEYGRLDITSFVAITYTVMFGMMFGDLGQGAVLALIGFLMWKFKKMELGKILIPCGVSSMCFGLVFGSFFGFEHFLDPLYKGIGMKGKPIEVMDSINTVLVLAIGIGVFLVAAAIVLNIIGSFKAGHKGEALFGNNGIAGLILYIILVSLAVSFMNGPKLIPSAAAVPLVVICLLILFFKEILIALVDKEPERMPESVMDFILQNVFELIEYILSYFSNTVSFLRVGAFVLVHAGMMMVVFSLAGANANIFVVILGNALVIALEGLLTGIQALRLEFYEMFSRCFEGSGIPFRTIKAIDA